ncbi:hypothetical protein [Fibrella aestuarina]|uniref:hypothetical protein n=1 Tax=Fibrella aestuarina TaxID=651143 RepID=UPI0011D28E80|nr:hypothetical protein [Fibrella aestuarina]
MLLTNCSSEKKQAGGLFSESTSFSKADFAGKTFNMAFSVDPASNDKELEEIKMQMTFRNDTTGFWRATKGSRFYDSPFGWEVLDDTLHFHVKDRLMLDKSAITKEGGAYKLTDGKTSLLLTE